MNPVVSVMVVTYNQEEYIEQTLDSILSQECTFPFEIVIGEDCSTDSTREICRTYARKHPDIIRLLENETNKGVLLNYTDTLLACRGEYIADLAGDDYWCDTHKLQRQAEILNQSRKIVACFTNYQKLFVDSGAVSSPVNLSQQRYFLTSEDIHRHMNCTGAPLVFTCTAMFRKSAFESFYNQYPVFFTDTRYTCEDFQLVFALLLQGTMVYDPVVTTTYRVSNSSVSNNHSYRRKKDFAIGLITLRLDLARQFRIPAGVLTDFLNYRLKEVLSLSIKLNEPEGLKEICAKAYAAGYKKSPVIAIYEWIIKYPFFIRLFQIFKK